MQNNQKVLMLGGGTSSSMLLRLMASSTLVPVDDVILSEFAVNDVEAALALSFITNEYRTGNSETTFADAFTGNSPKLTYSTSSNSTMTQGYGPELVTNGTFDTDTDWTKGAGWTISGGEASCDGTQVSVTTLVTASNMNLTVGHQYIVEFRLVSRSAGQLNKVSVSGTGGVEIGATTALGLHSAVFEAATSTATVTIEATSNFVGSIDNISVREAPKIVWAPHNLVDYSDDISVGATAAYSSLSVDSADTFTFTASTSNILVKNVVGLDTKGAYTARAYISGNTPGDTFDFELVDSGDGSDSHTTKVTVTTAPQWVEVTADFSSSSTFGGNLGLFINRIATNRSVTAGSTVTIKHIHLYRSDLGGMHPVPGADAGFGTYVPTNGNAEYLPRVGHHVYNGSAWVNEGLLIESEARTNLIYPSEFPTSAAGLWAAPNLSTAAVDQTGPDGSTSATTLTALSTGTERRWRINTTQANSTTYTLSFYAKAGSSAYVYARNIAVSGNDAVDCVWWDVSDFSVATKGTGITAAGSQPVGNGWYRCWMCATTLSSINNNLIDFGITDTATAGALSVTAGETGIFYGAQLEAGPTPSSYMPTSGGTYTRTAQSLTVPPAEFGWNSNAVSIQMDGRMTYADDDATGTVIPYRWFGSDAGGSAYTQSQLRTDGTNTGKVVFEQKALGTFDNEASASDAYTPGVLVPFNISSRHGSTFVNGAVDGVALTANTTPTALPDLSSTDLKIAYDFMGTIGTFRQFAGDIGDTGLVTATNPSTEPTLSLTFDGSEGSFYNLNWSE